MSFRHTRNRSTQSSNVLMRAAGMLSPSLGYDSTANSRARAALLSAELRAPLFKKCIETLGAILRQEAAHLRATLFVENAIQLAPRERLLPPPPRQRRRRRQPLR